MSAQTDADDAREFAVGILVALLGEDGNHHLEEGSALSRILEETASERTPWAWVSILAHISGAASYATSVGEHSLRLSTEDVMWLRRVLRDADPDDDPDRNLSIRGRLDALDRDRDRV